jgi:hypothetical protein
MVFAGVCCVVQENWWLEIMGRYGAELMRRSKQWRQAVGDGWNRVEDFRKASGGSQRRFFGGVEEDQGDNFWRDMNITEDNRGEHKSVGRKEGMKRQR